MIEMMVDVGQNGSFRFQGFGGFQGLGEVEMGWVWFESEGVQNQNFQSFQLFLGGIRDAATVGDVGAVLEAEPVDDQLAMLDVERGDRDIAEEVGFVFQLFGDQLWNAAPNLIGFSKNIAEVFIQVVQGLRVTINGQHGFVEKVKTAQFIDSMNMVGVVMGVKDGIDFPDSVE